ncbi:MAG: tyrosine-type recombinase/integrase, partial [Phycisphaerales bacterium]
DPKRGLVQVPRHKRRTPTREPLAVPPDLVKHLQDFIAWKRLVAEPTGDSDPLFVGKRGPLTVQGLQQLWKRAIRKAGLPKELSIHSARHTLAVQLLSRTKNLRQVQKQLGHTDPATTANMYADVSFREMQAGLTGLYEAKPG